jgi:hypothetical protein
VVVLVLAIFLWQKYKYKTKKYEQERYEFALFQDTSVTSVLNIEHNLRDYFTSLSSNKSRNPKDLTKIPQDTTGDSIE